MKLITELNENVDVIIESAGKGAPKSYYIEGIYIQADTPNRNKRSYPSAIMEREVARYTEQFITTKRALGELGHPETGSVNLHLASHLITSLRREGNNYIGRAKILNTPMGLIAQNFIDEGVKLGVSTRGFGSLGESNNRGIAEVGEDFYLATVDIVADPSAPDAFVNGIMEGKEFYLREGVITEMRMDQMQKQIKGLTKAQIDEGHLLKMFEKFMRDL
jgi:hypothetical protein